MDVVVLVGRVLFSAILVGGSAGHRTQATTAMTALARQKGAPADSVGLFPADPFFS